MANFPEEELNTTKESSLSREKKQIANTTTNRTYKIIYPEHTIDENVSLLFFMY